LFQKVGNEVALYAVKYLTRAQTSKNNLAMQKALVWLGMVQFSAKQFGVVWTGASYANL
jgi:hypothetical protein